MFTVKSAYQLGFDEAHRGSATGSSYRPDGRRSCWQLIWSSDVPQTVRNFVWRVATNSLPTWKNKYVRGIETSELCPICATETEDSFHALCRCTFSRVLWDTMAGVWTLPSISMMLNTGKEWLLHALEPLPEIERSMLLMLLWRAWHIRNEVVHNKPPPPMDFGRDIIPFRIVLLYWGLPTPQPHIFFVCSPFYSLRNPLLNELRLMEMAFVPVNLYILSGIVL